MRNSRLALVLGSLFALCIAAFAFDYFLYDSTTQQPSSQFNNGKNGIWLRYLWYAGKHTPAEFADMYKSVGERQLRYAYFHVLTTKPDGQLKLRSEESAKKLAADCRKFAPNVKPIAWVYIGSLDVTLS